MGKALDKVNTTFFFCDGGSCQKAGSEHVVRTARAYLRNNNLWDESHTIKTRCNGRCEDAPTCIIYPEGYWYKNLDAHKIKNIIKSHINKKRPVELELLYASELDSVQSDNERDKPIIKPFVEVNDNSLGLCLMTRGFHSDQYLYPLFEYLYEHKEGVVFRSKTEKEYPLSDLIKVEYKNSFALKLQFVNEEITLIIGIVPKQESLKIQLEKISVVEYFVQLETQQKGIRFKSKKGDIIGLIKLPLNDEKIWNYCQKIQLNKSSSNQTIKH